MTDISKSLNRPTFNEGGILSIRVPQWRIGELLNWLRGDRQTDPPLRLDIFPASTDKEVYVFLDLRPVEGQEEVEFRFERSVNVEPSQEKKMVSGSKQTDLASRVRLILAEDHGLTFSEEFLTKLCKRKRWAEQNLTPEEVVEALKPELSLTDLPQGSQK